MLIKTLKKAEALFSTVGVQPTNDDLLNKACNTKKAHTAQQ